MSRFNELTRGIVVGLVLAVLTGLEYLAGTRLPDVVALLVAFALVKAGLVLWYFMHLARVFRAGADGGHQ